MKSALKAIDGGQCTTDYTRVRVHTDDHGTMLVHRHVHYSDLSDAQNFISGSLTGPLRVGCVSTNATPRCPTASASADGSGVLASS